MYHGLMRCVVRLLPSAGVAVRPCVSSFVRTRPLFLLIPHQRDVHMSGLNQDLAHIMRFSHLSLSARSCFSGLTGAVRTSFGGYKEIAPVVHAVLSKTLHSMWHKNTADGTTDVTRTIHLGTPTEHQRRCYTLVLKGMGAISASCLSLSLLFPCRTDPVHSIVCSAAHVLQPSRLRLLSLFRVIQCFHTRARKFCSPETWHKICLTCAQTPSGLDPPAPFCFYISPRAH